ncbi:MAG: hypothetical protein LBQ71_12560 [Hungatella sp.]|jgi:hypothetical protein|nr:hypothetical protein [Hungatella sp.]
MDKDMFDQKILTFTVALSDMYRDEEEREGSFVSKLDLTEEELTEDFTAMIYAVWVFYKKITGDDVDILGFTHIANRLVFQKFIEERTGN